MFPFKTQAIQEKHKRLSSSSRGISSMALLKFFHGLAPPFQCIEVSFSLFVVFTFRFSSKNRESDLSCTLSPKLLKFDKHSSFSSGEK